MTCKALMKTRLLSVLQTDWTTPLDALNKAGCLSLSQRCGEFRRDGMKVLDKWVTTAGGARVKAYRLVK